jgi:orotate phosphoribosyltransferase
MNRTYEQFLRQAAITESHFAGALNFREFIRAAYEYAELIWENPMHFDFVDHGIEHAFHGKVDQLSNLERAVLTVAALIHDTGMQWDKYVPPNERMGPEQARKRHVQIGMQLLELSVTGENPSIPSLAGYPGYHSLFGYAGRIGFAHSGEDTWAWIVEQPIDDWGLDGQSLRFKLLSGALRLADEIDNGSSRIKEFQRLFGSALDDDTLAHWAACYYIEDVRVASAATGLLIEVHPRVPESSTADEASDILFLVDEYRIRRMEEECRRVTPFLRTRNTTAPLAEPRRVSPRKTLVSAPPERLRVLIRKKRAERVAQQVGASESQHVTIIAERDDHLRAACHEMQKAEAAGTLYSTRHVALRSGWHCSRYYQFARLLGEGPYLDLVTRGASSIYDSENFTYIIGIGTAGAQLASRLALNLGARFAYTFDLVSAAAEPGLRSGHTLYETEVELEPNSRMLIVDDIVGKGSSLAETITRIRSFANPPVYLRALCLISTGDAAEFSELAVKPPLDALMRVSGVDYWREGDDGYCSVCRLQGSIVIRER